WEANVAACRPELAKIDAPQARELLDSPEVHDRLAPVFETDFRRTTVPLQFAAGAAELAIDRGHVVAGGRREALAELELEMDPASARDAYALLLELARSFELETEVVNKAERGFRLLDQAPPPVVKARKPRFDHEHSVEQALAAIVSACLYQVQANAEGVRAGLDDVEYLHQMRVGLRRMRSALSTFSAAFPKALFAPLRDELKWLAGELGPARDWDVFVTETLPPIRAAFPDHAGLLRLAAAAEGLQARHNQRARNAAAAPRYREITLALSAWLGARSWREALTAEQLAAVDAPVPGFASAVLAKRHRQFVKRGKGHREFTAEELHQLRIAGKKLRYAAEFFHGLFTGKRAEAFIEALEDLQDILGAINDAATTQRLLEEIRGETADAGVHEAAGIVAGWGAQRAAHCRSELATAFKHLRRQKPFWDDAAKA
ncbi:MAG TPA: CHAD domain-containing protein, partial [Pelomicrobium sp.]|nr:CHAD domain-containing protein [Pelomicrobium sp.]